MGNDLRHYGILGMKWGRRKASTKTISNKQPREKRSSGESKPTPKKRGVRHMTNTELQARIRRLQLEQQYAQLTRKPSKVDRMVKGLGTLANMTESSMKIYKNFKQLDDIINKTGQAKAKI